MTATSARNDIQKEMLLLDRWSRRGAPGLARISPALLTLLASVDLQAGGRLDPALLELPASRRQPPARQPAEAFAWRWLLAVACLALAAFLAWALYSRVNTAPSQPVQPKVNALIKPMAKAVVKIAPPPTAAAKPLMARHKVKPGDCLWWLAARYLGGGRRWGEIYKANREIIKDPHWIYPGQRLKIPRPAGGVLSP